MGGCDISHIERRILAQPDHINLGQVLFTHFTYIEMVTNLAAHGEILATGDNAPLLIAELIRRVIKQLVPTGLCLFGKTKGAVAIDVDRINWVHLKSNGKRFLSSHHDIHVISVIFTWTHTAQGAMKSQPAMYAFSITSMRPMSSTKATSMRASVSCPLGIVSRNSAPVP